MKIKYTLLLVLTSLHTAISQWPEMVKDIHPSGSSAPGIGRILDGRMIFTADDGTHGNELWITDGTDAGTHLLKDIRPDTTGDVSGITYLGAFDGHLYFGANDGMTGRQLWRTDGTPGGTERFVVFYSGEDCFSFPQNGILFDDRFWFVIRSEPGIFQLAHTDGTEAGTDVVFLFGDNLLTALGLQTFRGSLVYGVQNDPSSAGLRAETKDFSGYDLGGWTNLADPQVRFSGQTDSLLFLLVNTESEGRELWVLDSGMAQVRLLKDIRALGSAFAYPAARVFRLPGQEKIAFLADDGIHGMELWISDGTESGTLLLKDILSGPEGSALQAQPMVPFGDALYFAADDGIHGLELWRTDGTDTGTYMVKDMNAGGPGVAPLINPAMRAHDRLYFPCQDGSSGWELCVTDGTATGTRLVADLNPSGSSSSPGILVPLGDQLWMTADDGLLGREWWVVDSDSLPRLAGDIHPTGDPQIILLQVTGKELYFRADDGIHGAELWRISDPGVSVSEHAGHPVLAVYPNPAGDWLMPGIAAPERLHLMRADGQLVRSWQAVPGTPLDLRDIPSGLYILGGETGGRAALVVRQ